MGSVQNALPTKNGAVCCKSAPLCFVCRRFSPGRGWACCNKKALLERKLARIIDCLKQGQHPTATVAYFEVDAHKEGGAYRQHSGEVKKIDLFERTIVFMGKGGHSGGEAIPIDDVVDIRSEWVSVLTQGEKGRL